MKAVFKRIRFSRKFALIGGVVLLFGGASGVAAIFVGKDRLLGTPQVSVNGLECSTVQTVNIKKNGTLWVRKFVRTEGGDGSDRLKTALRVAKAVYDKQKPDLVQVSVLDKSGPELRSNMRGRAIAAQAIFIPDVGKLPPEANAQTFSAYYYDGPPNNDGLFYGLRIDLPLEDTEALYAGLTEFMDCVDPAGAATADGGHGAKTEEKHGESHGETVPVSGHEAETPSAEHDPGHEGPVTVPAPVEDPNLLTSTPEPETESIFSFAYIKSLIFGKGPTTAIAAEQGELPVAEEPVAAEGNASH